LGQRAAAGVLGIGVAVGEKGGNIEVRRLVERRGRAERGSRVVGLGLCASFTYANMYWALGGISIRVGCVLLVLVHILVTISKSVIKNPSQIKRSFVVVYITIKSR